MIDLLNEHERYNYGVQQEQCDIQLRHTDQGAEPTSTIKTPITISDNTMMEIGVVSNNVMLI